MRKLLLRWSNEPFPSGPLLERVFQNLGEFQKSHVTAREGYRLVSKVNEDHRSCYTLPSRYTQDFGRQIEVFLRSQSDLIAKTLGPHCVSWEKISDDAVLSYGDGAFFKPHRDSHHSYYESRILTFVYIFYKTPKQFSGGDLIVYDRQGNPAERISASDGTLIVFDSDTLHEVTRISLGSTDLREGRFAFVGWGVRKNSRVKIALTFARSLFFSYRKSIGIGFAYRCYCRYLRPYLPHARHSSRKQRPQD